MKNELVKCRYCGSISYIEENTKRECKHCEESDLYPSIIGLKVSISLLVDDSDLQEWCDNNSWDNLEVTECDPEGMLIWVKDCPYAISVYDIV